MTKPRTSSAAARGAGVPLVRVRPSIAPLRLTCPSQRGEALSSMALPACMVSLVGQPTAATDLGSCRRLPGGCGGTVAKVKAMQQLQQQVRHGNQTGGLPFRTSELAAATVAKAKAKAGLAHVLAEARAAAARAKAERAEPLHRAQPLHRAEPLHRATPAQRPSSLSSACEPGGAARPPSSVLSASKLNRVALAHNLSAYAAQGSNLVLEDP